MPTVAPLGLGRFFRGKKTPVAMKRQSERLLVPLHQLRAEAQDLQMALCAIRNGEATLDMYQDYITTTKGDIDQIMQQIATIMVDVGTSPASADREVLSESADTIRHLRNIWEQMQANPIMKNPGGTLSPQEQLRYLGMLEEQIREWVFHIGYMTIPTRLNKWLSKAPPGYYVPFHLVFEDELPNAEDRTRVLNYIAWAPRVVDGGIVNAADGLVYRYNKQCVWQAASCLFALLGVVLGTGVAGGACFVRILGWPLQPANLSIMLPGWLALLVGIVVHAAVADVKKRQERGGLPPALSLSEMPKLIDAKALQIWLKLFLALIGFFGFVFTSLTSGNAGGVNNVTPLNLFLVGYSLDSFVEIFGTSIEQRASAQAAALRKQLGVESNA